MDYQDYTSEDFALDPNFRKWVLQPTKESNLFWEAWLKKYPNRALRLQEAKAIVTALPLQSDSLNSHEIDCIWNTIKEGINAEVKVVESEASVVPISPTSVIKNKTHRSNASYKDRKNWNHHRIGRVVAAASVILAFTLSFLLVKQTKLPVDSAPVWLTKENSWGQRSTIYLSDSTQVHLNAGSRISYPENFVKTERIVMLRGEAFFDVSEDPSRPFRVISAGLVTEALGTSFNIQAYDSSQVAVALVTGRVVVSNKVADKDKSSLTLNPGEGVVRQNGILRNKFSFDPESTLAWKEGKIFLKDADEEAVFNSLERWYGVQIIKRNQSKKPWNYTASYRRKSLEHILTAMAFVMDFDFEIRQKQVYLTYH